MCLNVHWARCCLVAIKAWRCQKYVRAHGELLWKICQKVSQQLALAPLRAEEMCQHNPR